MALRGITAKQEQKASKLTRDVRTIGQKVSDFLSNPVKVGYVMLATSILAVLFYQINDIFLLLNFCLLHLLHYRSFVCHIGCQPG